MKSKTTSIIILLHVVNLFAQLNFAQKAEFVGVQVNESNLPKEKIKKTEVSFIFNGKPKNYFYNLNASERELNIDMYDAIKGEIDLPVVTSAPFKSSRIVYLKIDLNKDIEGLEPDIRDVVRIVLKLEDDVFVDCGVTDDYNVVTLTTRWSLEPLKQVENKPKAFNWKLVSGMFAGAAITTAVAIFINEPPPPPPITPDWTPPPAMPNY